MRTLIHRHDMAVAFSLLSRLPVGRVLAVPDEAWHRQAQTVWAFPIVGLVLGGLAAFAGYVALALNLPPATAAGICVAVLVLLSGAMHEDGLADCADGFWGGSTHARRLEIMKDSQIGTYGVLALVLVTGLRWISYGSLIVLNPLACVAVPALSRGAVPAVMYALPLARGTGLAQRVGQPNGRSAALAATIGLFCAVLFLGWAGFIAGLAAGGAVLGVSLLAKAKIGGQTGDVLGAAQQMAELAALLAVLACAQ